MLQFESGMRVPIRMTVRYEDYKQFKSETLIKYGEEVDSKETKKP